MFVLRGRSNKLKNNRGSTIDGIKSLKRRWQGTDVQAHVTDGPWTGRVHSSMDGQGEMKRDMNKGKGTEGGQEVEEVSSCDLCFFYVNEAMTSFLQEQVGVETVLVKGEET